MRTFMTTKKMMLVAGALLALLAFAACGDNDNDSRDFDSGSATFSASNEAPSSSGDDSEAFGPSSPDSAADKLASSGGDGGSVGGVELAASARKIIFTSSVALDVGNVTGSFQTVSHIAGSVGGFVESSDLTRRTSSDGEAYEFATITIRVPSSQYGSVLEQLRSLPDGTVTHEDSRSTEVTEEYADISSRIRNLERTENRYLALLEEAETIQDILIVTDRLDSVRLQIEQLQGRINLLDDLVDLATIHVTLDPADVPVALVEESGSDGPADAFADAWDASLVAAGALMVVLAYAAVALMWLGPLALIALIIMKWRGRSFSSSI